MTHICVAGLFRTRAPVSHLKYIAAWLKIGSSHPTVGAEESVDEPRLSPAGQFISQVQCPAGAFDSMYNTVRFPDPSADLQRTN